jgi:hypothetical protein
MKRNPNVCNQMAERPQEGYSTLAEADMDPVVQQRSANIAAGWREEDEGYNDICQVIVLLEVWDDSLDPY